jgi:hypothetical protein
MGIVKPIYVPTVVPAECMPYTNPLFWSNLCTSATSLLTDAVGVPSGIIQKSAMHAGGVASVVGSDILNLCAVVS